MQDIDCVVIGRNCAEVLERTFASIRSNQYTRGELKITYVDLGSHDASREVAKAQEVQVIALERSATAEQARQAGFAASNSPLVQFLDAGSVVAPDWFSVATKGMRPETTACFGRRHELFPESSVWAQIVEMDRNPPAGEQQSFDSEVLLRRDALESVCARPQVLSQRVIAGGGKIVEVDATMLRRDSRVRGWDDWWTYCFHQGYGVAASKGTIGAMMGEEMVQRGGGALLLFALGIILAVWSGWWLLLCMAAIYMLIHPRALQVESIKAERNLSLSQAATYAWHRSFAVVPQFIGALRFLFS